jgi:Prealbumin-like fold domain
VLLLGASSTVQACSCNPDRPTCESFGSASAVFVGKVVGAAQRKTEKNEDGTTTTYDVGTIYFAVEEVFSGVQGQERVAIHSGTGGGDCGYWFIRGERYLVYAFGDPQQRLATSICTRTRPVSEADNDLNFLRRLPPDGSGVTIQGMVNEAGERKDDGGRKLKPLAGITITITSKDGKQTDLITDEKGSYEISGLKSDEYEVRATLPDYYDKDHLRRKGNIYDRGCARVDFTAIPNGRISGRIIDAEGDPVTNVKVVLVRPGVQGFLSTKDEIAFDYVNDERGRFELKQVPPGEYLLGLNITFSPSGGEGYPPTYYPGVGERSQATIIKIGPGEKLSAYTLRLPPKLEERVIEGIVVWPDGSPAAGAQVDLQDQNHPGWIASGIVSTDASGWFTLIGYEGIRYLIVASIFRPKEVHAEPPLISPNGPVSGLRLVLSSEGSFSDHHKDK